MTTDAERLIAAAQSAVERDPSLKEQRRAAQSKRTKAIEEEKANWQSSITSLGRASLDPTEFYIEGVLPKGKLVLFSGEGGGGKSTLAGYIALALALSRRNRSIPILGMGIEDTGVEFRKDVWATNPRLFQQDRGEDTLFVSWEDEAGQIANSINPFVKRMLHEAPNLIPEFTGLQDLGRNGNGDIVFSEQFSGDPLFEAKGGRTKRANWQAKGEALFQMIGEMNRKPALVVLDPSAAVFAGNENDRSEVRRFTRKLNEFVKDTGITLMIITHPPKSGAAYSGSTDWQASARAVITMGRVGYKIAKKPPLDDKQKDEDEGEGEPPVSSELEVKLNHDEEGLFGYHDKDAETTIKNAILLGKRPMYLRVAKLTGGRKKDQLVVLHTNTLGGNVLAEIMHARYITHKKEEHMTETNIDAAMGKQPLPYPHDDPSWEE